MRYSPAGAPSCLRNAVSEKWPSASVVPDGLTERVADSKTTVAFATGEPSASRTLPVTGSVPEPPQPPATTRMIVPAAAKNPSCVDQPGTVRAAFTDWVTTLSQAATGHLPVPPVPELAQRRQIDRRVE